MAVTLQSLALLTAGALAIWTFQLWRRLLALEEFDTFEALSRQQLGRTVLRLRKAVKRLKERLGPDWSAGEGYDSESPDEEGGDDE